MTNNELLTFLWQGTVISLWAIILVSWCARAVTKTVIKAIHDQNLENKKEKKNATQS